jgi:hypothetical protein
MFTLFMIICAVYSNFKSVNQCVLLAIMQLNCFRKDTCIPNACIDQGIQSLDYKYDY